MIKTSKLPNIDAVPVPLRTHGSPSMGVPADLKFVVKQEYAPLSSQFPDIELKKQVDLETNNNILELIGRIK